LVLWINASVLGSFNTDHNTAILPSYKHITHSSTIKNFSHSDLKHVNNPQENWDILLWVHLIREYVDICVGTLLNNPFTAPQISFKAFKISCWTLPLRAEVYSTLES
jgi:hypothetical protein